MSPIYLRVANRLSSFRVGLIVLTFMASVSSHAVVDESLDRYQPLDNLSGSLTSTGSDSMANLVYFWAEDFQRLYPGISVDVKAEGSSTGPPALINGTTNIAPMSRQMNRAELAAFSDKHGYTPSAVKVAIDALAVFVHRTNPIEGFTLQQIDSIFSRTLNCGAETEFHRWTELGIEDSLLQQRINLYGRNSLSGSYEFFRQVALCGGSFKQNLLELPGSASVIQAVSSDRLAIGFSGIGFKTAGVKSVPISVGNGKYIDASFEQVLHGEYPLVRHFYIYLNNPPGQAVDEVTAEFIKLILSYSGQQTVEKDGYTSLDKQSIQTQLKSLGL